MYQEYHEFAITFFSNIEVLSVGQVGIEPTRSCDHEILSLARIPVPPLARPVLEYHNTIFGLVAKG